MTKEKVKEETGGEIYTYEAKGEDEIDKKFAEIFNNSDNGGNIYPVKKIDDDPDRSNWRFYEYKNQKFVCE
jgi:hypothetical protein